MAFGRCSVFMYLAYNAPHAPIQVTKEYLELVEHIEYGERAAYGAMVEGLDTDIGKSRCEIERNGRVL